MALSHARKVFHELSTRKLLWVVSYGINLITLQLTILTLKAAPYRLLARKIAPHGLLALESQKAVKLSFLLTRQHRRAHGWTGGTQERSGLFALQTLIPCRCYSC